MPYIYQNAEALEGTSKVGSKHCVALLQHYAQLPHTSSWKPGETVFGNANIKKGTAIATFNGKGRYGSLPTGNHAAFFISQDPGGIWVMDQWLSDSQKPKVSMRYIRPQVQRKNGDFVDPSNNAAAYSVIE
ncbi:BPSL0067 family protein [Acidovorax sp. SUPP3334]|uniref:BPSL0067 family protein n=1 Tax=Acidovorax sp. SUPP3334 TaxID=2920881 RepID=UPI0023DE1E93|nr:BPSL0067 family protein [Acidovorax sp. SUPP3334]GKT23486.1 BPSL0067 family protein [Acidovorax sp. SUPP3334]